MQVINFLLFSLFVRNTIH